MEDFFFKVRFKKKHTAREKELGPKPHASLPMRWAGNRRKLAAIK